MPHPRAPGAARRNKIKESPIRHSGEENDARFSGSRPAGLLPAAVPFRRPGGACADSPRDLQNGLTTTRMTMPIISTVGTSLITR